MIASNINALGIIGSVIASAVIIFRYFKVPENFGQIFRPVYISFFTGLLLIIFYSGSLCVNGSPIFQWLIPSLCIFLILLFVSDLKVKIYSAFLMFLLAIVLCEHFYHLVETDNFTGDPKLVKRFYNGIAESDLAKIRSTLSRIEDKNLNFDSGFIEDSELNNIFESELVKEINIEVKSETDRKVIKRTVSRMLNHLVVIDITKSWHTFFSNIWNTQSIYVSAWYPGGQLEVNAMKIEFRKRNITKR